MDPHPDHVTDTGSLPDGRVSEFREAARVAGMEHVSTPVDDLLAEIAARRMELLKEAA